MEPTGRSEPTDFTNVMNDFQEQVQTIASIEQFSGAADRFIRGEISKQEATTQMMSFLRGDLAPNTVERERLLELAAEVQPQCATISITILTVTSCTIVLSCTGC